MRISGAILAAVIVVSAGAAPATAQLACPTPTPGPTPPPERAGFTCTPLAGGGTILETTCTFYGDVEWLISYTNGTVPPGTCGFRVTFENGDWILCPVTQVIGTDVIAAYEPVGVSVLPEMEYFTCNIPAVGPSGLAALGLLVLAAGVFVLWRRAG